MSDLTVDLSERDHRRGVDGAPVTLVSYCDFECPDCADGYLIVKKLQHDFGDQLLYVFRHFPLVNVHPSAISGARFAEGADKQGKFWLFHDFLYENQYLLQNPHRLLDEVTPLGLDVEWIRKEAADKSADSRIEQDIAGGKASGVDGTPTYFINGRRLPAAATTDDIARSIQEELNRAAAPS